MHGCSTNSSSITYKFFVDFKRIQQTYNATFTLHLLLTNDLTATTPLFAIQLVMNAIYPTNICTKSKPQKPNAYTFLQKRLGIGLIGMQPETLKSGENSMNYEKAHGSFLLANNTHLSDICVHQ